GSTITQQLAKILFLSPERTLRRKAHEALLALWLEWRYTKDEILAAYLNRAYYGGGAYGLDAASRLYFGHPAQSVTIREAALLAGLLKAPSYFAPTRSRDAAEARADVVLGAMVDAGYLTDEELANLDQLFPIPRPRPPTGDGGRYFADWVADELPQVVGDIRQDITVRTTLDPRLQRAAEMAVSNIMDAQSEALGAGQAAVVVMRRDGGVLALVGGRSYTASQFNRATQAWRQPGSAFKPIIYLAALEKGLRPDALVLDSPVSIRGYEPANYDGEYLGEITVTEALARSSNSAAVRMTDWVGIDETMSAARRLGLSGTIRRDLSLALGGSEATLLELTSVYAVFANGGRAAWPYAIDWAERSDGTTLYARQGSGEVEIVRPWHISELNAMLSRVIHQGTGRRAALDRPAAGKTGTSEGYRDAWFVGYTADLVAGVWVGNDDNSPMQGVTGGGLPAEIWREFMLAAHRDTPARALPGLGNLPAATPTGTPTPSTNPQGDNPIARFLSNLFGG
ncbi:MAG: transglycosylase domain-containing protein, partial [Pseudomonadota bacterium]